MNDEIIQEIYNIEKFNTEKQLLLLNAYFQRKPEQVLAIERQRLPVTTMIEEAKLFENHRDHKVKLLQKYVHR